MEMNEILAQLKEFCAGKSVEEIEQDIAESDFADQIPDHGAFARCLSALSEQTEEDPVEGPEADYSSDES